MDRDIPSIPLYFLHIPKTAGSSMRSVMESYFGMGLCPAAMWDDFFRDPYLRRRRFNAYSGHFGIDLPNFLQINLRMFTFLREPVARTISHYQHIHRDTQHPLHDVVSKQSLEDFVFDPVTASLIFNFQARYLVLRDAEIDSLASRFIPYWRDRYTLSVAWETASCYMDSSMLESKATEALRFLDYVGTTERFDEDLPHVLQRLGLMAARPERLNVAPVGVATQSLSPQVEERIRILTSIDAKLYAMAGSRLDEDSAGLPSRSHEK